MRSTTTRPTDAMSTSNGRWRSRRRSPAALAVLLLMTVLGALAPGAAHAGADSRPDYGEWHRLNPATDNPAPQHERLRCAEGTAWRCSYDLVAEPTLHANATVARFVGRTVTSRWECPAWFADHCDDVEQVVSGHSHVTLDDGTRFKLAIDHILTEVDGQEILWVHIPDFGVASPWYRTFDEAVVAAGFTPPYLFDGTNWPPEDSIPTS